ncbi:hypothetical protein KR222_006273, partial [Zaprionus bogoriensis]
AYSFFAVYAWLSKHPAWATLTLGVAVSAVYELIWRINCKIAPRSEGKAKFEVLIFNELSEQCGAGEQEQGRERESETCSNSYCSRHNILKIVRRIEQARHSIDIAMYTFTLHELRRALTKALQRGVQLRLITDHEMNCSSGSQIRKLNEQGVEVRAPRSTAMMHHKFMVVDGPGRVAELLASPAAARAGSIVVTGSANWTLQGLCGNWELCLISADSTLAATYDAEFARMWRAFEDSGCNLSAK